MKLLYFLVSEDVILDQRSNKVSVIKIVDRLLMPVAPPRKTGSSGIIWNDVKLLAIVNFIREPDDSDDAEFQLCIRTPKMSVPAITFSAGFDGKEIARSYIELPGLPDDGEGEYFVALTYLSAGQIVEVSWPIRVDFDEDEISDETTGQG